MREQPDQIIKECDECAFASDYPDGDGCRLADRVFYAGEFPREPPEWCPLREGPLTFRLAREGDDLG